MGLTDLKGASCCPFSAVPFTLVGAALFWVVSYNSLLSPDGTPNLSVLPYLFSGPTGQHSRPPDASPATRCTAYTPAWFASANSRTQTNAKAAARPWLHH